MELHHACRIADEGVEVVTEMLVVVDVVVVGMVALVNSQRGRLELRSAMSRKSPKLNPSQ